MSTPIQGLTVKIKTEQELSFLNYNQDTIQSYNQLKEVSNYEYETELNDKKRRIILLKKEYIPAILTEMEDIMKYEKSSQYVDRQTKKMDNPNII